MFGQDSTRKRPAFVEETKDWCREDWDGNEDIQKGFKHCKNMLKQCFGRLIKKQVAELLETMGAAPGRESKGIFQWMRLLIS